MPVARRCAKAPSTGHLDLLLDGRAHVDGPQLFEAYHGVEPPDRTPTPWASPPQLAVARAQSANLSYRQRQAQCGLRRGR